MKQPKKKPAKQPAKKKPAKQPANQPHVPTSSLAYEGKKIHKKNVKHGGARLGAGRKKSEFKQWEDDHAEQLKASCTYALSLLDDTMRDPEEDVKIRVQCAVHILNRGLGTPGPSKPIDVNVNLVTVVEKFREQVNRAYEPIAAKLADAGVIA